MSLRRFAILMVMVLGGDVILMVMMVDGDVEDMKVDKVANEVADILDENGWKLIKWINMNKDGWKWMKLDNMDENEWLWMKMDKYG